MKLTRVLCVVICFLLLDVSAQQQEGGEEQVYIVYLGGKLKQESVEATLQGQNTFLASCLGSQQKASSSVLYSYKHGFNGFAAKLTAEEAAQIRGRPEVAAVMPSRRRELLTTRSWDFLGLGELHAGMDLVGRRRNRMRDGRDVVIGMLDSGVWPESESFDDTGFPPVPAWWKGSCHTGTAFNASNCNKKVIGAKYYLAGYEVMHPPVEFQTLDFRSPRDSFGHGTHTASIAAGRAVAGANLFGLANGTARGGSPFSRIAVYKVCWTEGCYDADILAAFDDAINDGVQILSVSLGTPDGPDPDFSNAMSVGSFHALSHGILVVGSAGNDGPAAETVSNAFPWMLTVGASSIDRKIPSVVQLGDGQRLTGEAVNSLSLDAFYPLVSAADVHGEFFTPFQSSHCIDSSLEPALTKGKIVVCLYSVSTGDDPRSAAAQEVRRAGGVGVVVVDDLYSSIAGSFILPASAVDSSSGAAIFKYISSNSNNGSAIAKILPSFTLLGAHPAPQLAFFSSRGPSPIARDLVKPDVTAPGVNILAAWSQVSPPSIDPLDTRRSKFNILSGSSMACPHAAGLAALIKAAHPDWSPSAIKSAIVTTATPLRDLTGFVSPMNSGAGQIAPWRALSPGLVYDATADDYISYLCASSLPVSSKLPAFLSAANFSCPSSSSLDLNYPSIAVSSLGPNATVTLRRSVRNVGPTFSTYRASLRPPPGVVVTVSPSSVSFSRLNKTLSFHLTFRAAAAGTTAGRRTSKASYVFGSLTWSDGAHFVRSPIAVHLSSI